MKHFKTLIAVLALSAMVTTPAFAKKAAADYSGKDADKVQQCAEPHCKADAQCKKECDKKKSKSSKRCPCHDKADKNVDKGAIDEKTNTEKSDAATVEKPVESSAAPSSDDAKTSAGSADAESSESATPAAE